MRCSLGDNRNSRENEREENVSQSIVYFVVDKRLQASNRNKFVVDALTLHWFTRRFVIWFSDEPGNIFCLEIYALGL